MLKNLLGVILFLLLNSTPLIAQKETSYWATIGQQLIDVSVHPPKVIGNTNFSQWWSALSDDKGNFLFYTDGSSFYDRFNNLIGKSGVEHSYLESNVCIFPYPGKQNTYNIFFVGHLNNDITKQASLYHTIVDLSKKNSVASPLLQDALKEVNLFVLG